VASLGFDELAMVSSMVPAASRYTRSRVALADPVGGDPRLVVHRRRPLELEERDVRGARERDALRGDAPSRRR